LLQETELALSQARGIGRNRVVIADPGSSLERLQRQNLRWIERVKSALDRGALVPHFQPIVHNPSARVTRFECLARIVEGDALLSPGHFIEPARLAGLIPEISRAMILGSVAAFRERPELGFSINITEDDLRDGYLPGFLRDCMAGPGCRRPERLTFEVLESLTLSGGSDALAQLEAIKAMGFGIAIDDFGAEHSNFSRLLDLQPDLLKIDGRFVKDLDHDPRSERITGAIADLARRLEIPVVAEFVHSEAVQAKVLELGVDYSQGYLFGVPSAEIDRHLAVAPGRVRQSIHQENGATMA
jgi:EAL domain-containing protein (putative c-di-GMP-specific phosphodiesterase class I)